MTDPMTSDPPIEPTPIDPGPIIPEPGTPEPIVPIRSSRDRRIRSATRGLSTPSPSGPRLNSTVASGRDGHCRTPELGCTVGPARPSLCGGSKRGGSKRTSEVSSDEVSSGEVAPVPTAVLSADVVGVGGLSQGEPGLDQYPLRCHVLVTGRRLQGLQAVTGRCEPAELSHRRGR